MADSEQVLIEYRADISKLQADFKQMEAYLKKVEGQGKESAKATQSAFQSAGDSIRNGAKQIALSLAAAFSATQIITFGKESVKAFIEAEENANKLRFAVTKIGGEGQAAFQKLIDQSSKLQSISIFSDDDIQKAQTQLATLGLNSDQIEELIPKILDLASATGQDLGGATQTIIQGINGQVRGLKAVGLEFENTGDKTKNLSVLTEKLSKFQGATAEALETTAGKAKRLENVFGELQETVGEFIVNSGNDVLDFFDTFSEGFDKVTTRRVSGLLSQSFAAENAKIIADAKTSEKRRVELVVQTQQSIAEIGRKGLEEDNLQRKTFLLNALKSEQQLLQDLQTLNDKKNNLGSAPAVKDDKAQKEREDALNNLLAFDDKTNQALLESKAQTDLQKLELSRDTALKDLEITTDAARAKGVSEKQILESTNKDIAAIIEKFNIEKAAIDKDAADKEFAEAMAQAQKLDDENVADVKKNLAARLKLEEDAAKARLKLEEDTQKAIGGFIDDVAEISKNVTDQKIQESDLETEKQIKNLDYQLEHKLISQTDYDSKVAALEKAKEEKQRALRKQQFETDRQISIAKIIIATAQAVITQFAETGYYGAILAGVVGAAELAVVASQPTPQFEKGGKVKGKRHYAGGTLIEAEKDEWIIRREQSMKNDKLLEAINSGAGDKYILDYYVAPALKAQQRKMSEMRDKSFASNIANSMNLNFKDGNIIDSLKMSRKNDREIALFLAKELRPKGRDARRG